jgi:hypothetical protein
MHEFNPRVHVSRAALIFILLSAANCAGEEYYANYEAERAIYTAVLEQVRVGLPTGDSVAVYPRFIVVDPEYGPRPGGEPEYYLRGRPTVLAEAVNALPGTTLCSDKRIGRCPQAIDGQHITLSAIQASDFEQAAVWVLITDLTPGRGSILYKLAKLDFRAGGWEVGSYDLISTEHMF